MNNGNELKKRRPMKFNVLHVISKLPVGGVENMLSKVVKDYDKALYDVSICCIKEGGDIADDLIRSGYDVIILNKMKKHGFDAGTVTALYKYIRKKNIHILRTHQYHANLYGRIAGVLARVPVIIPSFHSRYESPNKPKIHRRFINHFLSYFSDTLVAVSNTVAMDITRYDKVNPKKIRINYNGVVIDKFNLDISKQEAREVLGIAADRYIIGTVGRLREEKGHSLLLKAASRLRDCQVLIAGDGPLLKELQELAASRHINCRFMGQISPNKVPLFLRALDIFCFPSYWEGLATSLIEAMATGLPVVASDIPSHREVLNEAGLFIRPGDTRELTRTLEKLMDDPSIRLSLSNKARERAKLFSLEKTVKTYESIFIKTLREKKLF
jgi:glycosyltransferase involved in cell wall biosynthesis